MLIIQLRRYIKQSIPDDMRGQVWNKMIGSQAIRVISSFNYLVILILLKKVLEMLHVVSHVKFILAIRY